MAIDKKEIEHIAGLARLELTPEEEECFGGQLSSVLGYIEKLNEVETAGVTETAQVSGLENVLRADEVKDWPKDEVAAALAQGEIEGGQVKVKRIL